MSTTEVTSSDAVSTWEQAYHNAWRHFHASIGEILNILTLEKQSPEDRQATIEKLSHLPVELDNIRSAAQDMFEHVPGCSTVRQQPVTYFVDEFVHECNYINYKLNMMSWRLMNWTNSERAVHNRLSKLLESLGTAFPKNRFDSWVCRDPLLSIGINFVSANLDA